MVRNYNSSVHQFPMKNFKIVKLRWGLTQIAIFNDYQIKPYKIQLFFLLLDHFSVYFPNKAKRWRFSLFTCQVTTQNYALHILLALPKFFVLVTKKRLINQFLVLCILFENHQNVSFDIFDPY